MSPIVNFNRWSTLSFLKATITFFQEICVVRRFHKIFVKRCKRLIDSCSFTRYGGPERFYQYWPIEKISLNDYSYITKEDNWTAIAEPYWLNSLGAYVYVDQKVPLFIDQNIYKENAVCFIARADNPYRERSRVLLNYTVAALSDSREAHLHAVNTFLGKPSGKILISVHLDKIWSI